jgi:hypothetical protein
MAIRRLLAYAPMRIMIFISRSKVRTGRKKSFRGADGITFPEIGPLERYFLWPRAGSRSEEEQSIEF